MNDSFEGSKNPTFEAFALEIFERFHRTLPLPYKLRDKIIPFAYLNSFFSWLKIGKEEKKLILKIWQEKNLCKIRKFHGISLVENSPEERDRLYFQLREEVERVLKG
ncbi:MAG: hypothetical protein QXS37_00845 [Candidatus Aenigmatarchaeota archaeon]